MNAASRLDYVVSFEEVSLGLAVVALIMAIHGIGVVATVRTGRAMQRRSADHPAMLSAIGKLVVVTWMLVVLHLIEVLFWGLVLWGIEAFPNLSIANYYCLMQYTTVGSDYRPPEHWRLLGGMIAISGLLTFAFSTSALFTMAEVFYGRGLAADWEGPVDDKPR